MGHGTKTEHVTELICNLLSVNHSSHAHRDTPSHANTSTKCESMVWTGDKVEKQITGTQANGPLRAVLRDITDCTLFIY